METKIGKLTELELNKMIENLRISSSRRDHEASHIIEDKIKNYALKSITEIHDSIEKWLSAIDVAYALSDCNDIAKLALTTIDIEFSRYYI